jgi:hypothetical protein
LFCGNRSHHVAANLDWCAGHAAEAGRKCPYEHHHGHDERAEARA